LTIEVREATEDDFPAVAKVTERSYEQYADRLGPQRWNDYRAELTDIAGKAAAGAKTFIVLKDGEVAGAVSLYRNSPSDRPWPKEWTFVRALAVAPEHRGNGIGQMLMKACIEQTQAWDAPVIFLRTAPYMKSAMALYESMGFEKNEEFSEVLPNRREIMAYLVRF